MNTFNQIWICIGYANLTAILIILIEKAIDEINIRKIWRDDAKAMARLKKKADKSNELNKLEE